MIIDLRIMGAMTYPGWKMVMAEDLLCGDATLDQERLLTEGHWLIGGPPFQTGAQNVQTGAQKGRGVSDPSKLGQAMGDQH